jgi:hypothetical protein
VFRNVYGAADVLFEVLVVDNRSTDTSYIADSLNCVHPQDRESIASLIERILTEASPFDTTKRIVRPDGEGIPEYRGVF